MAACDSIFVAHNWEKWSEPKLSTTREMVYDNSAYRVYTIGYSYQTRKCLLCGIIQSRGIDQRIVAIIPKQEVVS